MSGNRDPDLTAWSEIAQIISSDAGLIRPAGARLIVALMDRYARVERVPLSPQAGRLRAVCAAVAAGSGHVAPARSGHADVRSSTDHGASQAWIRTAEAAALLGLSPRHCLRLMDSGVLGPTRRISGNRHVLRDEVAAMAAEREASAS